MGDGTQVLVQTRLPKGLFKKFDARAGRFGLTHAAFLRMLVTVAVDPSGDAWREELSQMVKRLQELP